METNKILSFEEFSTKGTDTATVDAPTVDATPDAETTTDTTVDTETTDSEETTTDTETTDTEETTTDTETTDTEETTTDTETTDTEETEEEPVAAESVQINEEEEHKATVAEMYEKACTLLKDEAMAYEADDYEEHTKGTYMKETANLVAEGHCNAVKEMYDTSEGGCTTEQFEAACNEIKEAYAKKCNEMIEAYATSETQEVEPTQAPDAAIVTKNEA